MVNNEALILDAFRNLVNSPQYQNQWLCDETIFRVLSDTYPNLARAFQFERRALNRALKKEAGQFDISNSSGLYSKLFKSACPYSGERQSVNYYYYCASGSPPSVPKGAAMEIKAVISTKYHAEYAGEGIEYAWGILKKSA